MENNQIKIKDGIDEVEVMEYIINNYATKLSETKSTMQTEGNVLTIPNVTPDLLNEIKTELSNKGWL